MADFHFIRPEWFFALIPLLWMLWQLNRQKLGSHGWQQIIPSHLVEHLMQGKNATQHRPFWLLAVIWFIVVVALAGPAWEKLPQPVYQTNTGKVLVMDMSQSMLATDLTPNRLTKARFKAIDLIDKIDDADMGLIAYSGDAFVISPLTADSKNLTALIPSLSPNIMPLIGSNAYAALDLADSLLKNAGYTKGEIYWITDGIDQAELKDIRELLSQSNHRVSVLGVGTAEGAPIKQSNGELLKDGRGSIIIPKLNDSHLRAIARATDGAYVRVTSTAVDIETLAQQELISREAKKEQDEQLHQGDQYREFGPIMVMLILPFAAYAFRRGLVFAVLLTSSLMLTTPAPVLAADEQAAASKEPETAPAAASQGNATPSWWTNMWQTQDQQGADHYSQENYADAAQTFDNSQWKGSSLYKSGDYEGALKEFQQSNDATGLYNQGNAHAKMQNFDEAIKAYEKALEQNPDMEDAQKNLDLIKQMQEQQQQQQQNQDGENQEQQDQQNQDQQNQDQQNQQGQQNQNGDQSEQQQGSEQQDGEQQEGEQQEDQQGQQGEKSDTQPREQNQQQGDQDPQAQQKEDAEKQSVPGEEQEGEEGQEGEQQLKPTDAQSTEEKEQMQEIQQLIRKINDDPAVLLRNKMQLEYQKRKYQNSSPPGAKSW